MKFSPETNNTHLETIYGEGRAIKVEVPDEQPIGVPEHNPYRVAANESAAISSANTISVSELNDTEELLRYYDCWEARDRKTEALAGYIATNS